MKTKGENGVLLTQGLFHEFNNPDAPFTLRDQDFDSKAGKTYTSMKQVYMSSVDEFDAVRKLGLSMSHWRKLCSLEWFMEGLEGSYEGLVHWREDMRLRDESLAKAQLIKAAEEGSVAAQKELLAQAKKEKTLTPKKRTIRKPSPISNIENKLKAIQSRS